MSEPSPIVIHTTDQIAAILDEDLDDEQRDAIIAVIASLVNTSIELGMYVALGRDEHQTVYDEVKSMYYWAGIPWRDPRTGVTYQPPKAALDVPALHQSTPVRRRTRSPFAKMIIRRLSRWK